MSAVVVGWKQHAVLMTGEIALALIGRLWLSVGFGVLIYFTLLDLSAVLDGRHKLRNVILRQDVR